MTDPTRTRWRAVHALAPTQRIKPSLAAATVGALFSGELLHALQRRGLLPEGATPAPAAAPRNAQATAEGP